MPGTYQKIRPEDLHDNPFSLIGKDWMLITAGTKDSWNTMTASWGGLGVLWNRNVCFCFVRYTRHTWSFMEKSHRFTLSFFEEKYRPALNFCGSHSGRDCDKAKETGLHPVATETGNIYFSEARLVLECEKIYFSDILPANFLDGDIVRSIRRKTITACMWVK